MTGLLAPWTSLLEALSSEVVRKLRLAGEADTKDDRDIICEEVFCDVTGLLDETAQAQLGAPARVPFYVVLAQHYATPRGADSAVAVLHLLQSLFGQGYAAPLLALLLHRWLLLRKAPGRGLPEEQRTRLANVLALGSAQLFLGDVHGGARAFEPLWRTLCYEVILGAPEAPPPQPTPSQQQQQQAGQTAPPPGAALNGSAPGASVGLGPATPAASSSTQFPLGPAAAAGGDTAGGAAAARQPQSSAGAKGGSASAGGAATASGQSPGGLASLPVSARTGVLAAVASFLVYYADSHELPDLLCTFPSPTAPPSPSLPSPATTGSAAKSNAAAAAAAAAAERTGGAGGDATQASSTSGSGGDGGAAGGAAQQRRPPLASPPWHGVDFILSEVVDTLTRIRSEAGLVHYLTALQRLGGQPALQQWGVMRLDTRLRLQGTLYGLSSLGGPHYAPPAVRSAALAALDCLFPTGRTSRWLVRMLFRLLHPADWLGDVVCSPLSLLRSALSRLALSCFLALHSLVLWGAWGGARRDSASGGASSTGRGVKEAHHGQHQPHDGSLGVGNGNSVLRRAVAASAVNQRHARQDGGGGGGPASRAVDADAAAHHYVSSHHAPH